MIPDLTILSRTGQSCPSRTSVLRSAGRRCSSLNMYEDDFLLVKRLSTDAYGTQSGPLIFHPLIYHFPTLFYGVAVEHSMLQKCVFQLVSFAAIALTGPTNRFVYAFVMLHFLKREIETMLSVYNSSFLIHVFDWKYRHLVSTGSRMPQCRLGTYSRSLYTSFKSPSRV